MTRCYEYYCMFVCTPEKCDIESGRGRQYVKRYIHFMQAYGIRFDKSAQDKTRFLRLVDEQGTERSYLRIETEKTGHEQGVERSRAILSRLGLPLLPPHLVYCESYHPDLTTRLREDRFVVIDFVNSVGQFNFDIGGLTLLLMHKDILETAIAVIAENVFPELVAKVKEHQNPTIGKFMILDEAELESYLKECMSKLET